MERYCSLNLGFKLHLLCLFLLCPMFQSSIWSLFSVCCQMFPTSPPNRSISVHPQGRDGPPHFLFPKNTCNRITNKPIFHWLTDAWIVELVTMVQFPHHQEHHLANWCLPMVSYNLRCYSDHLLSCRTSIRMEYSSVDRGSRDCRHL